MEKKADAMAKYGKAAMTEMIIKVLPEMAGAIAKPLEAIDKVTIIDSGNGETGVGSFSSNVPSVLAKTIESVKETTGFDLTEVMKANTYDAKTTKNVNLSGNINESSEMFKDASNKLSEAVDSDKIDNAFGKAFSDACSEE